MSRSKNENRHRRRPADEQRPEVFQVGANRPPLRSRDNVGRFGEIARHEKHDEEFDDFDGFELIGTDANPKLRTVDFLTEHGDECEEHDRTEHPHVFIGGKAAKAIECRARDDDEHERNREPYLLTVRERAR